MMPGPGDLSLAANFRALEWRLLHDLALDHWLWLVPTFLLGACIGSFLNVVIHRLPLGLSVNDPKRSFCPQCKAAIPLRRNIPLLSWLLLRGKCADCKGSIPIRYFGVELLTALLFTAAWFLFPLPAVFFIWVLLALLVAVTFIDIDHLIIPGPLTTGGSVAGLIGCALWPQLPVLGGDPGTWLDGLIAGGIGWAVGFFGLWGVVELSKLAFGKRALKFEQPVAWELREPTGDDDPLRFVIDGQETAWWDIFFRKSDRLVIDATEIRVDGRDAGMGTLTMREQEIELPDGSRIRLEDLKSLDGMATASVIPREAMGMGDVHLLGMIGAFFGWSGVVFALSASSIFGIVAAVIGRVGFGRPLPFGPFLAMGALAWAFGGWRAWAWYVDFLAPLGWS